MTAAGPRGKTASRFHGDPAGALGRGPRSRFIAFCNPVTRASARFWRRLLGKNVSSDSTGDPMPVAPLEKNRGEPTEVADAIARAHEEVLRTGCIVEVPRGRPVDYVMVIHADGSGFTRPLSEMSQKNSGETRRVRPMYYWLRHGRST